MRRTLERKFEGMSPRARRQEVLRMQRIERAARALLAMKDILHVKECAVHRGATVSVQAANLRDLADALGMYDGAQSVGGKERD